MAKVSLKAAAPSTEDFDSVYQFNRIMNSLTDDRMWRSADESDWKDWDENDEDYKLLKSIEKNVCWSEDVSSEEIDQRLVLWAYVKWFFNNHPSALGRILMCADMAMENAFNKESDTIEWNKDILELIKRDNEGKENTDTSEEADTSV